jgi:hypothetical protein
MSGYRDATPFGGSLPGPFDGVAEWFAGKLIEIADHVRITGDLTSYLGTDVNDALDGMEFLQDATDQLVDAMEAMSYKDPGDELTA